MAQSPDIRNAQKILLERKEALGIKDASMPRNEREREVWLVAGGAGVLKFREQQEARQGVQNELVSRPVSQAATDAPRPNLTPLERQILDAFGADMLQQYRASRRQSEALQDAAAEPRETLKVYPSLWATARQHGLDNALRVYWLAGHLEPDKRGKLSIAALREALTAKGSELRAFGWRRLRQILAEGEGILWTRATDASGELHLWRRAPWRVLQALDGGRMRGRPVSVPVSAVVKGKHAYSAAMLSAWHAGRGNDAPISQATIRRLTDVAESTQRTYQKTAKIESRRNIALLGEKYTPDAHKYGVDSGVFVIRGKRGAQFAYALPNSYKSTLERLPKGRARKHNRHLVSNAERGKDGQFKRVFFENPSSASEAATKERRITFAALVETTHVNVTKRPRLERAQLWREYRVIA